MTRPRLPRPLRAALLCAAVLLALAACADEENVRVEQFDCDALSAGVGSECGGTVFAVEYLGQPQVLAWYPTAFPPILFRIAPGGPSPGPAQNLYDGRLNTGLWDGNHPAAETCRERRDGGHDDWYLPAVYELLALLALPPSETRLTPGQTFWSSSEYGADPNQAWAAVLLAPPASFSSLKDSGVAGHGVLCIRRPKVAYF